MDLWHTEIKNVSMRIWGGKWDEDVMWGHEKPNPRWIKMRRRSSKKIHSSRYIVSPPPLYPTPSSVCVRYVLRGGGKKKKMLLFVECLSEPFICKVREKMRYIYGGQQQGGIFSLEAGHRVELLTGWGVGINHATAVSNAGASSGLKRAVVSSCVLLPNTPLPTPLLAPLKMCHLNKLTSIRSEESILPGVAKGLW